tara:strand:+ start:444 stop:617 length:174 start_codon:yes stop_codon:yes gene_type:complete
MKTNVDVKVDYLLAAIFGANRIAEEATTEEWSEILKALSVRLADPERLEDEFMGGEW